MNICMISMEFPPVSRGVGYYVYNLSKKLVERGHSVTVLTRGSWKKTQYDVIDNIPVYRVKFLPIYPFHLHVHRIYINESLKKMEEKFDILHLHNPLIPVINTNLPTVITEHGTVIGGIKHHEALSYYSLGLKLFSPVFISIERELIKRANKVTAVSISCASELMMYYNIKDISVVYNGVDTAFFKPNRNDMHDKYILYIGNLDARKGIVDLIKAAKLVLNECDVKFIIIGRGPLENYLKDTICRLKLDNKIEVITKYISRADLLRYYQNATIFVHPSLYEGLPTTILEAMACGIPIIATKAPGTSEIVIDGKTGFLVPPKDYKGLANAIKMLVDDSDLARRLGKKGRNLVEKSYDWDVIALRIFKIYKDTLK